MRYAVLLALFITGCGIIKDPLSSCSGVSQSPNHQLDSTSGLSTFSTAVHPILVQTCGGCHRTGGSQFPPLGDTDINTAYPQAKQRMNFSDLNKSLLWTKVTMQDHQGTHLNQAGSTQTAYKNALLAWSQTEGGAGSTGTSCTIQPSPTPSATPTPTDVPLLTATTTIPNFAALGTTVYSTLPFQYVRIPLDSIGLTGGVLEMGLRRFTDASGSSAGFVEIANPRLYTPQSTAQINSILVHLINGPTNIVSNAFVNVNAIVPMATSSQPANPPYTVSLLATNTSTMQLPATTNNLLQFEIKSLGPATETQYFTATVNPILATRCAACHAGGNGDATAAYDLSGNDSLDRTDTLPYVTKTNPSQSRLLTAARDGVSHGGGAVLKIQNEINSIINWIAVTP
ncbi:MAG: hypothetical protein HYR96_03395 [Deltaproteobacteria bacterium]|nr:hypothetical protein [Deltaproteobacteria bacterium]MBI3294273.1 hypothetical protein [Deltaproteobacteria bacterium]